MQMAVLSPARPNGYTAVSHPPHFQENGLLEPTACGIVHSACTGCLEDWMVVSKGLIDGNELHSQYIYIYICIYIYMYIYVNSNFVDFLLYSTCNAISQQLSSSPRKICFLLPSRLKQRDGKTAWAVAGPASPRRMTLVSRRWWATTQRKVGSHKKQMDRREHTP